MVSIVPCGDVAWTMQPLGMVASAHPPIVSSLWPNAAAEGAASSKTAIIRRNILGSFRPHPRRFLVASETSRQAFGCRRFFDPPLVPPAMAAVLAAGAAVLVAVVALLLVAAFVVALPLVEIALFLVIRHDCVSLGRRTGGSGGGFPGEDFFGHPV